MRSDETLSAFVAYAEEWNNYPSDPVALRRYRKGRERGTQWGQYAAAWDFTPGQVINIARRYHWSPDYAEGIYDALQAAKPVEETA